MAQDVVAVRRLGTLDKSQLVKEAHWYAAVDGAC